MGRYTQIPQSTFSDMQLDAGVLLYNFDVAAAASNVNSTGYSDSDFICATTGGITVSCVPTYSDLGDDVDNAPTNVKELKHLDSWACTLGFTSLSNDETGLRLALGAADVNTSVTPHKVVPRRSLNQSDFTDLWWVGDRADGGFVAVKVKNALSTSGLSLTTSKAGKGQIAVELTGHVSLADQDVMPMEFYSIEGAAALAELSVTSVAGSSSGKTGLQVRGYKPGTDQSYKYKVDTSVASVSYDDALTTGWTAWTEGTEITAQSGKKITLAVVVTASNKARAAGSATVVSA